MTDLTEQWKKGELPNGIYYVELFGEITTIAYIYKMNYKRIVYRVKSFKGYITRSQIKAVLYEVPTYEKWQKILHHTGKYECEYTSCVMDYENLKEENEKLKEKLEIAINALKSCRLSKKTVVTDKKEFMYIWDYALEKINAN